MTLCNVTHSSRVHFDVLLTPSSSRKHNSVSQQSEAVVDRYLRNAQRKSIISLKSQQFTTRPLIRHSCQLSHHVDSSQGNT